MLEKYLKQFEGKMIMMNRELILFHLHRYLAHCYTMKGDLSTAIQRFEETIKMYNEKKLK